MNLTLKEFAEKVNKLAIEQCEMFNISGKSPFKAKSFSLPESFYKPYFESGLTPEQTLEEMEVGF